MLHNTGVYKHNAAVDSIILSYIFTISEHIRYLPALSLATAEECGGGYPCYQSGNISLKCSETVKITG